MRRIEKTQKEHIFHLSLLEKPHFMLKDHSNDYGKTSLNE